MASRTDPESVARLVRQVHELKVRLQTVRQETADQVKNAMEEEIFILQQDAARSRQRLIGVELENANFQAVLAKHMAGPNRMVVQPRWPRHSIAIDPGSAFLLMPFRPGWANQVHTAVVRAVRSLHMRCDRGDELTGRDVMGAVWRRICECGVVIADLTEANPNVAYEIGLVDAIGQPSVLICQKSRSASVPFNFLSERILHYSVDQLPELETELAKKIANIRQR